MVLRITYFVHGTTTDNEQHTSSGWSDVDLSDLGIKQSLDLKRQIDVTQFDIVFCSDLKRAIKSAQLTFGGVVPIIKDPRLRECNYGDFNGKSSEVVEPLQEVSIDTPFPNGESYEDVKARVQSLLDEISVGFENRRIAIVAHKAPQLALDVITKNMTWQAAFEKDWRKQGAWQPGWEYVYDEKASEAHKEEKREENK